MTYYSGQSKSVCHSLYCMLKQLCICVSIVMLTSSGLSYSRSQSASNGIHLSMTGSLNHLMPLPQFLHRVIGIFIFLSMRDKIVLLSVAVHSDSIADEETWHWSGGACQG